MAIKGITDRVRNRPVVVGKVRIGEKTKSKSGKTIPTKLDYFKFVPDDPALLDECRAIYGTQPTTLEIRLPSNDIETAFPTANRWWKTNVLQCYGDGEVGHRLQADNVTRGEVQCPCDKLRNTKQGHTSPSQYPCKPEGTLNFILPDLPTLGIWQLGTSIMGIHEIWDSLAQAQGFLRSIGADLMSIPLQLTLIEREAQPMPGQAKMKVYIPRIDVPMSLNDLLRRGPAAPALPVGNGNTAPPLPLPIAQGPADDDEIEEAEVSPPAQAPPPPQEEPPAQTAQTEYPPLPDPDTIRKEIDALIAQVEDEADRNRMAATLANMMQSHPANLPGFKQYVKSKLGKVGA